MNFYNNFCNKKVLIVGSWQFSIYEKPLFEAFKECGLIVSSFEWKSYFNNSNIKHNSLLNKVTIFFNKLQNWLIFGPIIRRLNTDLISKINEFEPDIIFLYRPTHIQSKTIIKIKNNSIYIVSFHNDDPFKDHFFFQRHYFAVLKYMNVNYVYRKKNIEDLSSLKIKSELLLPYPNNKKIFPIKDVEVKYDLIFIGHYENDGRDLIIQRLIDEEGITFMLFGTGWHKSRKYKYIESKLGRIYPVYEADYNLILNSSKIALCFFSKINSDSYTRRTFEIPASGSMLLSEYSKDSVDLLEPNQQAVYFRTYDELISIAKYYLANESERKNIANLGRIKVLDKHLPLARVNQILNNYYLSLKEKKSID